MRNAPVYHNCNRGSCRGGELVALKASAAASGNVVPTAVVAVVVKRPNDPAAKGGLKLADSLSEPACTSGVHC